MELLVKIALIIAMIISVTLFVVAMILSISIFTLISDYDKYENLEPKPENFVDIINAVHHYTVIESLQNKNSPLTPYSTEMMYCVAMDGEFEIAQRTGDIEISTCLLNHQYWLTWSDIWDYIPDENTTPFELECVQADGMPVNAPKPFGKTVPLCLIGT